MTMIITQNHKLYILSCKLVRSIANVQFDYSTNARGLQLAYENHSCRSLLGNWRCCLSILFNIYIVQCTLAENIGKIEKLVSWSFLGIVMVCQIVTLAAIHKHSSIRHCVNALFQMERILPKHLINRRKQFVQKANVMFAYSTIPTEIIIPIVFAHGLHWINPCKPTLAGFWLIPSCKKTFKSEHTVPGFTKLNFIIKLVVILVNHWQWSFIFLMAGYTICIIQTLAMIALQQFVDR